MNRITVSVAIVLAAVVLAGCEGSERIANAPRPGDTIAVAEFEWRVVDRDALMAIYRNSGLDLAAGQQLEGFAGVDANGVSVIYTLPPRTVDDQVTCTVGHEVMHIALGKYHGEMK